MRSLAFCSWWLTIAKPPTQKPEGEATAPPPTPEMHRCRPAVTSRQQPAPCAPFWIFLLAQLRRRVFRWWVGEPRGLAASCCHHAHRMPCASWGELVGRHGSTVVGSHRFPRRSRPAQAWSLLTFLSHLLPQSALELEGSLSLLHPQQRRSSARAPGVPAPTAPGLGGGRVGPGHGGSTWGPTGHGGSARVSVQVTVHWGTRAQPA